MSHKGLHVAPPTPVELDYFRPITTSIIIPVIIANEQLLQMTMKCLQHIGTTTDRSSTEVILIDNGSKLPAYFRTDGYVKNPINIGYGPAINQGVKLARGKYIVPMNNDVFVQEGWLEKLIEGIEADKLLGVIRPIQANAGGYGAEKRKFGEPVVAYDKKDFHGFCYLMRKETFEELGGMDEQFRPGYCEDMDLWVRLTEAGYGMAKHMESKVEHLGGATSAAGAELPNDLLNTNRKKFKEKHGFDVFTDEWYSNAAALRQKFGEI